MAEPDETLARVADAVGLAQRGKERERAAEILADLWQAVGPDGDPLACCAIAHAMADLQADAAEELVWDLRALAAAGAISDERAAAGGVVGPVASFYPSLHLNLGDVYRRLGDTAAARRHVGLGLAACDALGADGYAAMVRRGLDTLARRLL